MPIAETPSLPVPPAARPRRDGPRRLLWASALVLPLLAACGGGGGSDNGTGTPGGTTGGDTSTSGGTTGGTSPVSDRIDPDFPTLSQSLVAGEGAVFKAEAADGGDAAAGFDADGTLRLTAGGGTTDFKTKDVESDHEGLVLYASPTSGTVVLGTLPNKEVRPDLSRIIDNYTTFGAWAEIEPTGKGPGPLMRGGAFYGGVPTPMDRMPTRGTGEYGGGVAAVVEDAAGTGILTSGEIEANVDFASGKLDSTWYVFTPTATDSSAKINFRAEDVPIDGRTFAGRATSDRGHSGTIEGGFFGVQSVFHTRAPEIAGRFDLEGSAGSVTGAFAAGGSCDAGICPSPASPTPPPPAPP